MRKQKTATMSQHHFIQNSEHGQEHKETGKHKKVPAKQIRKAQLQKVECGHTQIESAQSDVIPCLRTYDRVLKSPKADDSFNLIFFFPPFRRSLCLASRWFFNLFLKKG